MGLPVVADIVAHTAAPRCRQGQLPLLVLLCALVGRRWSWRVLRVAGRERAVAVAAGQTMSLFEQHPASGEEVGRSLCECDKTSREVHGRMEVPVACHGTGGDFPGAGEELSPLLIMGWGA